MTGEPLYCQVCNESEGKEYALRLENREGSHTHVDMILCHICVDELHALDWIKKRLPQSQD
jgi:hypothetical protein